MESHTSKKWFYRRGNQQFGPVDEPDIVALFEKREIGFQTWVWCEGMENWSYWCDTPLYHALRERSREQRVAPPPFPTASMGESKPPLTEFETKMNNLYFHFWLWTIIGLALLVVLVGIAALLVAMVFQLMILYQAWKSVPENKIKVPPILAVLLTLVPYFGEIWMFWAYYVFAQEMNDALAKNGSNHVVDDTWAMIYCVLSVIISVFVSIPATPTFALGLVVTVPQCILGIYLLKSFKEGTLEMYRKSSPTESGEQLGSWTLQPASSP